MFWMRSSNSAGSAQAVQSLPTPIRELKICEKILVKKVIVYYKYFCPYSPISVKLENFHSLSAIFFF